MVRVQGRRIALLATMLVALLGIIAAAQDSSNETDSSSNPAPNVLIEGLPASIADKIREAHKDPFPGLMEAYSNPACWDFNPDGPCGPESWRHLFFHKQLIVEEGDGADNSTAADAANKTVNSFTHAFRHCASPAESPIAFLGHEIVVDHALNPIAAECWDASVVQWDTFIVRDDSKPLIALRPVLNGGRLVVARHPNIRQEVVLSHLLLRTPSDHSLGGGQVDLEVQLIHYAAAWVRSRGSLPTLHELMGETPPSDDTSGDRRWFEGKVPLVVSFLFRTTTFASHGLFDQLIPRLARAVAAKEASNSSNSSGDDGGWRTMDVQFSASKPLKIRTLLPSTQDYLTYEGSLTMPPCTPDVSWIVFWDAAPISRAHMDAIRALVLGGDADAVANVSRPANTRIPPVNLMSSSASSSSSSASPTVRRFRAIHADQAIATGAHTGEASRTAASAAAAAAAAAQSNNAYFGWYSASDVIVDWVSLMYWHPQLQVPFSTIYVAADSSTAIGALALTAACGSLIFAGLMIARYAIVVLIAVPGSDPSNANNRVEPIEAPVSESHQDDDADFFDY